MRTDDLFAKVGLRADAASEVQRHLVHALAATLHDDQMLTTREAARYAGVSPKTLRRWADQPGSLIERVEGAGRAPDRYRRASIDQYLAAVRR